MAHRIHWRRWLAGALLINVSEGAAQSPIQPPAQPLIDHAPAPQEPGGYVIVSPGGLSPDNPHLQAVRELAAARGAVEVLDLETLKLDGVAARLGQRRPRNVAFIVPPDMIEDNFVGAVFEVMTRLDDPQHADPQLDAAWGFITGATPDDALALVRRTIEAEARARQPAAADNPAPARRFVAIAHTFQGGDLGPFTAEQGDLFQARGFDIAGINPIDDSPQWRKAQPRELQKLKNASLVFIVGHGMGDMSCGVSGAALGEHALDHAVVVNGTCHSAVTITRRDATDMQWTIATHRIDPAQSVCLNFIRAGAVAQLGSTASSSWMNVALAIDGFLDDGLSMGEALVERLNSAIAQAGVQQVIIERFRDGQPSPQAFGRDPDGLQSLARVVLIGDPAFVPFPQDQ